MDNVAAGTKQGIDHAMAILKQEERHQFQNRLRILRSIDGFELGGMLLEAEMKFVRSPYEYFIRCSDENADIIFEALLKREK